MSTTENTPTTALTEVVSTIPIFRGGGYFTVRAQQGANGLDSNGNENFVLTCCKGSNPCKTGEKGTVTPFVFINGTIGKDMFTPNTTIRGAWLANAGKGGMNIAFIMVRVLSVEEIDKLMDEQDAAIVRSENLVKDIELPYVAATDAAIAEISQLTAKINAAEVEKTRAQKIAELKLKALAIK